MHLLAIKQHLLQTKVATLTSLCMLFKTDKETMRCLLKHWMRKGCVRLCQQASVCGSVCSQCPFACTEIYEWVYNP